MKRGKKKGKEVASKKKTSKKKVLVDDKKLLAVCVGLFLVFAIALAFVNVPQNASVTGQVVEGISGEGDVAAKIGTFFTNVINPETTDPVILKWVIFFTFTLLLWAAISMFIEPGKKGKGFLKLASLPVAFAMVYLLKPEEIFAALIGYSALGMTLIVVGPFLAIVFFSAKLLQGRLTAAKIIAQLMVWYFYLASLIYFLIRAFFTEETYSFGVIAIIAVGIILGIAIIVGNKKWRSFIAKLAREGVAKGIEDVQEALGAKEKAETKRATSQGEGLQS